MQFLKFIIATLFAANGFVACKTRQGADSELQESDPLKSAVSKVDAFYLELGRFKKEVDEYFVPAVASDYSVIHPEKTVKMSRIVEIEKAFDEVLDALSRANLNLGDELKSDLLDQQKLLVKSIFPSVQYSMPDLKSNSFLSGMRGLQVLGDRSRNWELFHFCGEIYGGRKTSMDFFLSMMTDNVRGVFDSGRFVRDSGLPEFITDEGKRALIFNLAGRPKIRGLVHTQDLWTLDPETGKTETVNTGAIGSFSKDACKNWTPPASPKDLEKYPRAVRERIMERKEFDDCPEEFKYSSTFTTLSFRRILGQIENVAAAVERVKNLEHVHRWFVRHCEQIAKTIDELNIERGQDAFPMMFWGVIQHKYKPGYTRKLAERGFKEKLEAKIELMGAVREALGRSASDAQKN